MALDGGVLLLILVGVVCLLILAWTGRKRFPLRIGVGNFFRRRTQVAIVVAGLLIGTSIITSSFVIQSTFDYTIRSTVFRVLDRVDETITAADANGSASPFPATMFDNLYANRNSMPTVDAMAPRFLTGGAVVDNATKLLAPTATVVAYDPSHEPSRFVRLDGSSWDGSGLTDTTVIVNDRLAGDMEAKAGDPILLSLPFPGRPLEMTILEVVQNSGLGAWGNGPDVFLRLDTLWNRTPVRGLVNVIVVSNVGGPTQGYLKSDTAVAEIQPFLPTSPAYTLSISKVKADQVDQSTRNVDMLSQIFVLLGSFTIIAGVILIVNIFVMLAEERKGEMGVSRALGMRRTNLVQSFVAEGLLYALLSAAVGTFGGLLVAGAILWGFDLVFPRALIGGMEFVLTWTWLDLVRGFAIGFLITMGTIALASWRVSKLNIVRAIRDVPEPVEHRSTARQLAIGAAFALLGLLMTIGALLGDNLLLQDLGPSLLALGLAVLTMRVLSPRIVFTAAGAFIVAWMLSPWKPLSYSGAEISLYIQAGLLLVFGGLLVVMFNSDTLLAVATRVVRRRTWQPVVRTAIAYPMNKKFRTGATLASIALVMFTIATMSGIQSLVDSTIQTTTLRESGGFNLLAQSGRGIPDWPSQFAAYNATNGNLDEGWGLSTWQVSVSSNADLNGTTRASLIGVPHDWNLPPFEFQALDPRYTPAAAWQAVQTDPSLAIIDGSAAATQGFGFGTGFGGRVSAKVGSEFYYRNFTHEVKHVQIVGVLYEQFTQGFFVGWDTVQANFNVNASTLFFLKVHAGVDVTAEGHDLEHHFFDYQMITIDVQSLIDQILEIITGVFNLLQAYLALGLVVGIAGLGVITMRNVVERRQETGALRALGFRKSMVLKSYLLELSFLALTGILLGTVVGVALSYDLYLRFFEGQAAFIVPWARLLLLGGIAFLGSVLATASPAIRASRLPPAEALRSFE